MKKRITVWFLCLSLFLAGMPLQVLADEGEQEIQEELQQDVNRQQADKTEAEMPLQEQQQDKLQQKEKYTEKSLLENPAFSCTQEFPQQGVRVTLSAEAGVVPEDAQVQITPVPEEDVRQMEDVMFRKLEERERQKEERSVFDMYAKLQPSLEQQYFFDVTITYTDSEGNPQIFEPGENQTVQMAIENINLQPALEDEMKTVGLFHLSGESEAPERTSPNIRGRNSESETQGTELISDHVVTEENRIVFQAEHFSSYGVAVVSYRAVADEAMITAEKKAWDIINTHADPAYFLEDPERKDMTEAQYLELQQAAAGAVAGCVSDYEKIRAITAFVSDRTYYDYPWYEKVSDILYIRPYDVYIQRRTVCSGYALLTRTLMNAAGIPCMYIGGEDHAYNAAYDSNQKKWIFLDTTWCSWNRYTADGIWEYGGYSFSRFDLTPEEIAELSNHEVYGVDGLLDGVENSAYYTLETEQDEVLWKNCNWYYSFSGARVPKVKCVSSFAGFEVAKVSHYKLWENSVLEELDLSALPLEKLEMHTFYECEKLQTVKFPGTLKEIEDSVFAGCSSLKKLDLSATRITELKEGTLNGCSGLQSVKTPATLTKLHKNVFSGCKKLSEVDLSESGLTKVDDRTFGWLPRLKTVKLPSTVETLGECAFYSCPSLKNITMPEHLKKIEEFAFGECTALQKVSLSKTKLSKIGKNAFYGCTTLQTVHMPKTLKRIETSAFGNCKALREVDLSKTKVSALGSYAFSNCTSLQTVALPSALKKVGEQAFVIYKPKKLKKTVVITPLSAEKIGLKEDGKFRWYGRQVDICKKSYRIKFKGNGATSGSMEPMLCGMGVKYTLRKNKYVRKGYVFQGWNTRKNGKGTSYKNKGSVKNLTSKNGKTVTLYAQWKKGRK